MLFVIVFRVDKCCKVIIDMKAVDACNRGQQMPKYVFRRQPELIEGPAKAFCVSPIWLSDSTTTMQPLVDGFAGAVRVNTL